MNRLPPVTIRVALSFLIVPALLVLADVGASRTSLKYLLLPPFGALAYLVFINPARVRLGWRQIILAPTLTAVWAWLIAGALGYNAPAVAVAVIGTMAIMWSTGSRMVVPPMALALLTLLLHNDVRWRIGYLISVLVFTVVMYAVYRLWLRLPLDRVLIEGEEEPVE